MRTIQRDTKLSRSTAAAEAALTLNRHGLPVLDPPFVPRPVDHTEEERHAKLQGTEAYWEDKIQQQHVRRPRGSGGSRLVEPPSNFKPQAALLAAPIRRF